jgi:hypothetical protein
MLKKATSGVLALLPCSRTGCTLRASKGLRPCWADFFEHSRRLLISNSSRLRMRPVGEIFNRRPVLKMITGSLVLKGNKALWG